jgi:hypothetical protein
LGTFGNKKIPYLELLQGRQEDDLLYVILDMEHAKKKSAFTPATKLFQGHPNMRGTFSIQHIMIDLVFSAMKVPNFDL